MPQKVRLHNDHQFQDNVSVVESIRDPKTGAIHNPLRVIESKARNYIKGDVVILTDDEYAAFLGARRHPSQEIGLEFTEVDWSTPAVNEGMYADPAPAVQPIDEPALADDDEQ